VLGAGSLSAMLAVRSTDGGLTWSPPRTLIQDTAPFFNDKNSVTADPFDERFVYAVWDRLQQNAGGPAYFARSVDAGATWEPARIAYDPGATSQIIGAELVVIPSGDLLYFFSQLDSVGTQTQASVAFVRSRDRGQSWGRPTIVSRSFSVGTRDPETGAVVRDGGILMHAAAGSGTLAVAWQDGRFSNGARDGVAFSQSRDGGVTWSDVVQINAAPAAGAFTPQPQISNDGLITVGYFDLRANTSDPATLPATYWLARSTDGRNWTETSLAGPFNLSNAANAGGAFIGDYVGLVAAGSSALSLLAVSGDDLNNRSDIFFATSSFVRAAGTSAIRGYRAIGAPEGPISPELDGLASENIVRSLGPKLTLRRPEPRSR